MATVADHPQVWQRSSACTNSTCVEVGPTEGGVGVRDAAFTVAVFDPADFAAFVAETKAGKYDHI